MQILTPFQQVSEKSFQNIPPPSLFLRAETLSQTHEKVKEKKKKLGSKEVIIFDQKKARHHRELKFTSILDGR